MTFTWHLPGHKLWFLSFGLCVAAGLGFAGWIVSLPPNATGSAASPVPQNEYAAMIAQLKPKRPGRPLVAIVGINDATETTDYVMTQGILKRSGVVDVMSLAPKAAPVKLYPALAVIPDASLDELDRRRPDGADYVIVPAMSRDDDPEILALIRAQAEKGATIIGVCAGAKVVGAAGMLDGKRATTHWYYRKELLDRSPTIRFVPDRRMVADKRVVTTTGITASMPMMLILIEAIAGRARAEAVARDLGLQGWDARHSSQAFRLTRPFVTAVLANRLAFWNREQLAIELEPGMDEVSLALVADAWSRTYRSRAVTFAASNQVVETANGLRILPDRTAKDWPEGRRVSVYPHQPPAKALDQVLQAISQRYGEPTSDIVAMQLEYLRKR